MTENFLTELKLKIKELTSLLKENNIDSININLSDLNDLTVCDVDCSNKDNVTNFMYFFNNLDLQCKSINKEHIESDGHLQQREHISKSDDDNIKNTDFDKSKEEISVTILKSNDLSKKNDSDTEVTSASDKNIEESPETTNCDNSNIEIKDSSSSSSSQDKNDFSIPKDDCNKEKNFNKNSRLINFQEENVYQKNTITRILKEFNLLT